MLESWIGIGVITLLLLLVVGVTANILFGSDS